MGQHEKAQRVRRARQSLEGLSVADALGEQFFGPAEKDWIRNRESLPLEGD